MDYGSDDDLLVVTGGGSAQSYNPTNYATSPQTDADFAISLQAQRAEMRLANQQASNLRHEIGVQNNTMRSVVPVPEGLPTSEQGSVLGRGVAGTQRRSSAKGDKVADSRVAVLEEEVRGLSNQLQNQAKGLQRMTTESEKQAKLIATLNAKIDREMATNRDLSVKLKLTEAQSTAQKKEMQVMQRESSSQAVGITSDTRLQKALEEIANLKTKIATMGSSSSAAGTGAAIQQQTEQLVRDKKKLELQRVELLNCIRKQNKLIEVLRRQKLHLEASKLLQMTEEDFTKVLEAH